jgi:hypothetical protein
MHAMDAIQLARGKNPPAISSPFAADETSQGILH